MIISFGENDVTVGTSDVSCHDDGPHPVNIGGLARGEPLIKFSSQQRIQGVGVPLTQLYS